MKANFKIQLLLIALLLITYGGYKYLFSKSTLAITERIPYGLPVGTEITRGVNFESILSWKGESSTLKERFEAILLEIEKSPDHFESLTQFLYENNNPDLYSVHSLLFALEFSKPSHYRAQFLKIQESILENLFTKYSNEPLIIYMKASLALQNGKYSTASQFLNRTLQLSPDLGKAHSLKNKLNFFQCKYDSLLLSNPYSLTLDPGQKEANYNLLLQSLFHLGYKDSTNNLMNLIKNKYPFSPQIQKTIALIHEQRGDFSEAKAILSKLAQLYPDDSSFLKLQSNMGKNSFPSCSQSSDEAFLSSSELGSTLQNLLAGHPNNPWIWLALWEYEKGRNPSRAKAIKASIQKQFDNLSSLFSEFEIESEPIEEDTHFSNSGLSDSLQDQLSQQFSQQKKREKKLIPGQYPVKWGISQKEFSHKFSHTSFFNYNDTLITHPDSSIENVKGTHFLVFGSQGFSSIIHEFYDSTKTIDVLGRVLRAKSRISGNPSSSGDMECKGFLPFQFFIWESADQFELIAQFSKKTWQTRGVRLSASFIKNRDLCEILPRVLPPELNK